MLEKQSEMRSDCQHVMHSLLAAIDHREIEDAAKYFTDDGCICRDGTKTTGHVGITKMLSSRPIETISRHYCSNFLIENSDSINASARCYILLFTGKKSESEEISWNPPKCVDYQAEFSKIDVNWLIKSIEITPVA